MKPISVIIPAYNESGGIAKVIDSVRTFMVKEKIEYELIVVDDCSSDDTAAIAKKLQAMVVSHPLNRGYGAAITTGLKKARYEDVLIMDADESYSVEDIKKMFPYLDQFDMVVGARQGRHYHGSIMKRFSRIIFYILLGYVTGEKVPDANSGLRMFKKSVAMQFEDDFCNGFSFTTTLTIILLSNGYLVKYVPIEYRARAGKSKVRHIRDTARTVQILLHNISYYNPIKAFLPFSVLALLMAMFFCVLSFYGKDPLFYKAAAIASFLSSMLFMSLGMVAYVMVKGSGRNRNVVT